MFVCDRVKFRDLEGRERDLAQGMIQMFCELGPFTTFGTITVAPRHDRCGVSAHTMERLMLKVFRKRRFKGMKFTYFVESNPNRPGTHGHFTTANEPPDLRWSGPNSVGEYMIEKYGRFQTKPVDCQTEIGLAAYLGKYCTKEHADGHWGFVGWDPREKEPKPKLRSMSDKDPALVQAPEVIEAWKAQQVAWNWQKQTGRKIRQHSGSRENGRTNVRTFEVRVDGQRFGHFEQTEVYNNAK